MWVLVWSACILWRTPGKNKYILNYNDVIDSTSSNTGSYMDKKWGGAEMQLYFDVLGGLALKGEYLTG